MLRKNGVCCLLAAVSVPDFSQNVEKSVMLVLMLIEKMYHVPITQILFTFQNPHYYGQKVSNAIFHFDAGLKINCH